MSTRESPGFTLVELLVVIAIIATLVGLLMPAVQSAREAGRRSSCQNNLRQFAVAMANYETARRALPPGTEAVYLTEHFAEADVKATANALLLPYLEETALSDQYDYKVSFLWQQPLLCRAVIPIFTCPTNDNQMFVNSLYQSIGFPVGDTFATTDYAFCHGATDAWCVGDNTPKHERGAFSIGEGMKLSQITDGTSHTIAMGEAAGGDNWPLCLGPNCEVSDPLGLTADVPWLIGMPVNDMFLPLLASSVFGSTVEPMNKRPVTNSMIALGSESDCRSSTDGGQHMTSNFRSDHPAGALFLLCDGSVQFINEEIDLTMYRRLATIGEGEQAELP